jgi:glycosyltransferase involved in cell wall biosynthesis
MKLVVLSPTFPPHAGGAESLADDLTAVAAERGHALTVVTATGPAAAEPESRRGVRVFRLPPAAPAWRLATHARRLLWYRRLLAGADAAAILRVDQTCWPIVVLRRTGGFRLTVYLHGGELRALQRESPRFRRALRAALAGADAVVAVSETLGREATAFAPAVAAKLHVLPNGVDVGAIRATPPAEHPRPYCLVAGRLAPVKNPALAIEAFARAKERLAGVDLVVAGDGPEAPALAALAASRGVAARVHLLGAVPRERVWALLRGARCAVVPSLAESHPVVVLEAWAAGAPVVASDVKGIRELVRDGESGVLFPSGDADRLAAILIAAARAPLAVPGDADAFDIRRVAGRHLAVLEPR